MSNFRGARHSNVDPKFANNKWTIATGNVFYNCQTGVSYTVSGDVISASLDLEAPADFVCFSIYNTSGDALTCNQVKGWKDVVIGSEMTFSNVTCTGYMTGFDNIGNTSYKDYYGRIVSGETSLNGKACNFSVVKNGKVYEHTATPSSDKRSFYMDVRTDGDKPWAVAEGKLPGLFTVGIGADGKAGTADDVKVRFSKGNLYADGSYALHFEANQYAFSSSYQYNHISHFTWSSTVEAAVNGPASGNYLFCDESHKVSVDDGEAIYYALSKDEWVYLINTRTMTNRKARYSNASPGITIGGTEYYGVFLYPDNYNGEVVVSGSMTWDAINAAGIVFLPAAGYREGPNVSSYYSEGFYWSSSECSSGSYLMYFNNSGNDYTEHVEPSKDDYYLSNREKNYSIRLVTEVK